MRWDKGWTTWDDVRKEVFTPEEIAESDLRVALIGELTKARREKGISQRELEELSGVKQPVKEYFNFTIADIEALTDVRIERNKRNGRKQAQHLVRARAVQDIDYPNHEWAGRPKGSGTAQKQVYEWRQQHPEGRKADCIRETGLSKPTVYKWWDCPPPAVRYENGHITVRVSPSQELSDWLVEAMQGGERG